MAKVIALRGISDPNEEKFWGIGDEITGWDKERIEQHEASGLVRVVTDTENLTETPPTRKRAVRKATGKK